MNSFKNISFVTNIRTPYRDVLFNGLHDRFINFNVFYLKNDIEDREWQVCSKDYYHFLPDFFSSQKIGVLNRGLCSLVKNSDLVIIGGYDHPTYILLSLLCVLYKKKYALLFDGIAPSRIQHDIHNKTLKFYIKKIMAHQSDFIIANGRVGLDYFKLTLGVNSDKIVNQYLSVNNSLFTSNIDNKKNTRLSMRNSLGISCESKVFLYSGRFIERKKIHDLIEAIALLKNDFCVTLLLVGEGPEKSSIKDTCLKNNIRVIFAGFVEQELLYKYYFSSDVYVLPSINEPWGLVINEAVASELPIVVSDDVGAYPDLVVEGVNGFVFENGNIHDLACKLRNALKLNYDGITFVSTKLMSIWNINNSIDSFTKAINKYL